MINRRLIGSVTCVIALVVGLGPVSGGTITYVTPTDAMSSNTNWPTGTTYTQNFGYAFKTGSSGPFSIDWVDLQLNTSGVTAGSGTIKVALHAASNSTAYSAVASATAYATDTVSFTKPTTTSTGFTLNLTSVQLPNLTAYDMQSNTAYALIVYAPSVNIGMGRRPGYTNGTTNNFYTVTNGFTVLDTFRGNAANYASNANSFPTVGISFGATTGASAVPEPGGMLVCGLIGLGLVYRLRRTEKVS